MKDVQKFIKLANQIATTKKYDKKKKKELFNLVKITIMQQGNTYEICQFVLGVKALGNTSKRKMLLRAYLLSEKEFESIVGFKRPSNMMVDEYIENVIATLGENTWFADTESSSLNKPFDLSYFEEIKKNTLR